MWFKVDDQLTFHPKAMIAGNEAMGLWVRLGAHCSAHLTDGKVDANVLVLLDPKGDAIKALVASGFLAVSDDGEHELHDYLVYNYSRKDAESLSKKRRRAGSKGGSTTQSSAKAKAAALAQASAKAKGRDGTGRDGGPSGEKDPPPRKPRKPKPAPAEKTSDHKTLVAHYFETFERARGMAPTFGAREGKAAKALLESCKTLDRAMAVVTHALAPGAWPADATILTMAADPARHLTAPTGPVQTKPRLGIQPPAPPGEEAWTPATGDEIFEPGGLWGDLDMKGKNK